MGRFKDKEKIRTTDRITFWGNWWVSIFWTVNGLIFKELGKGRKWIVSEYLLSIKYLLCVWHHTHHLISFYPYNNSVEIGIIFLITIYRNENWVPKNESWWTPHSYVAAATAAKSLQSCPTLCDPTDGSPLGSSVPGILQARVLEWGATAFSDSYVK